MDRKGPTIFYVCSILKWPILLENWALSCSLAFYIYVMSSFSTLFGSVVVITFQSIFRVEIHQNNIFLFLKNYFYDQRIKTIQNIYKKLIFSKKN